MMEIQREISLRINQRLIGKTEVVLVEGPSKKSPDESSGRTDGNRTVVFPRGPAQAGEYRTVLIERVNSATLFGRLTEDPQFCQPEPVRLRPEAAQ
jgi:tRNA-2-methylthio-N6-dimethylallyladenosine synthase